MTGAPRLHDDSMTGSLLGFSGNWDGGGGLPLPSPGQQLRPLAVTAWTKGIPPQSGHKCPPREAEPGALGNPCSWVSAWIMVPLGHWSH